MMMRMVEFMSGRVDYITLVNVSPNSEGHPALRKSKRHLATFRDVAQPSQADLSSV